MLRDFKKLCRKLGFEPWSGAFMPSGHTFSVNYIRQGGSQFHLLKILGHTSLEMTKKYVNLQTADIQAIHERFSLLSKR